MDTTNQYVTELAPYYAADKEVKNWKNSTRLALRSKTKVDKNVEEGGSTKQFETAVKKI